MTTDTTTPTGRYEVRHITDGALPGMPWTVAHVPDITLPAVAGAVISYRDEASAQADVDYLNGLLALDADARREAFRAALGAVTAAEHRARLASWLLPVLPKPSGVDYDPDDNTSAQVRESGYEQWADLVADDDGNWHATTDGWDDMSETGSVQWVEINGIEYATPEDLDYD